MLKNKKKRTSPILGKLTDQSMKTLLSQSSKPSIFDPLTYQNIMGEGSSPSPQKSAYS